MIQNSGDDNGSHLMAFEKIAKSKRRQLVNENSFLLKREIKGNRVKA